jgi:hypothetical protein
VNPATSLLDTGALLLIGMAWRRTALASTIVTSS